MAKNIFKNFIVLFSLVSILVLPSFVFADDIQAPVITLSGASSIDLFVGENFIDAGATALDETDGAVSVIASGSVDINTVNTYTITYTASDIAGNIAILTRIVKINALPIILNNITITTPATKLSYKVVELLDISGLIITGNYSDSSTKVETITIADVSGFDSSVAMVNQILTITFNGKTTTYQVDISGNSVALKENFIIRNGDDLIWEGQFDLPDNGKVSVVGKEVDSKSVLGILSLIGEKSDAFSVSDLKDYGSMGLYLKCITPKDKTPLCENWQYAVGATTPWTSIDTTMLSGGETVGIYFGASHHVLIDKTNLNVGDTLSATSEKYNYENNIWSPLTGVSIGLTTPNPSDEWNPNVIGTYLVDENGNTKILINNPNTYNLGIVEDYYFPSYSVVVSQISRGGGGGYIITPKSFSIENSISYLSAKQKDDGSFGDSLYTDWSAIAISLSSDNNLKSKVINYLKNNLLDSSTVTDNERHAMALMSLDINPYSGTSVDYIKKITDSFDGVQFGDASLDNDDIFALIVLSKAGYSSSDEIIKKEINYLIYKQLSDGSWGSVDLTAAAIQALNNFRDINGVSDSILKALKFLTKSQQNDGGFGNSFSTSWAIQGLSTESSLYSAEIKKADDYLISKQQTDGGLENLTDDIDNRIWATSYAIAAISHKPWSSILNSFQKIITVSNSSGNSISEKTVEKIIEKPIILDLPIVEIKKNEIKVMEEKIINKTPIKNKIVKNIKSEKLLIKATEKSSDTKSYINPSNEESLPVLKKNIFSNVSDVITLNIKAFFGWLLVSLGF